MTTLARLGVLVSGEGSNLQALLDAVANGSLAADVRVVISNKPNVRALERAERAGVEAVCIPHREFATREQFDHAVVSELRARGVDWVVFAGFMRLVTDVLLDAYAMRILNLHPSLLPAFPGVDAVRQALAYGSKVTGCTVHLVTRDMDSGPIVAQAAVPIAEGEHEDSLLRRVHEAEHRLLVEAVRAACEGRLEVVAGAQQRPRVVVHPRETDERSPL